MLVVPVSINMWYVLSAVGIGIGTTIAVLWMKDRRRRPKLQLAHSVVVITGASSGLGEALVRQFHTAGARVIALARSVSKMEKLAEELATAPRSVITEEGHGQSKKLHPIVVRHLDLNEPVTERIISDLANIYDGRVDILINNAGMSYRGDINHTTMEVHRKLMNVNYFGHIELTAGLLPNLRKSSLNAGVIVGISSIQGRIAIPYRSAYSAAKHAFQAFFDTLRAEEAAAGIRVVVVSPSYIRTSLSLNAVTASGTAYGQMDANTAKGMSPEDLAARILSAVEQRFSGEMVWMTPAIWLRSFFPSAFFWAMKRRAMKGEGRPPQ